MKTLDERKRILDEEILRLNKRGWTKENRTDTTCKLRKEDEALGCLSILSTVTFGFILSPKDKTRNIKVTSEGIIEQL